MRKILDLKKREPEVKKDGVAALFKKYVITVSKERKIFKTYSDWLYLVDIKKLSERIDKYSINLNGIFRNLSNFSSDLKKNEIMSKFKDKEEIRDIRDFMEIIDDARNYILDIKKINQKKPKFEWFNSSETYSILAPPRIILVA